MCEVQSRRAAATIPIHQVSRAEPSTAAVMAKSHTVVIQIPRFETRPAKTRRASLRSSSPISRAHRVAHWRYARHTRSQGFAPRRGFSVRNVNAPEELSFTRESCDVAGCVEMSETASRAPRTARPRSRQLVSKLAHSLLSSRNDADDAHRHADRKNHHVSGNDIVVPRVRMDEILAPTPGDGVRSTLTITKDTTKARWWAPAVGAAKAYRSGRRGRIYGR